jgi:hypothetical protein
MPLELGMFLGVKRAGDARQRAKACLILDREPYRFQKFISDIAGQDIRAHAARQRDAISRTRDWLRACSGRKMPGGAAIHRRYREFRRVMRSLYADMKLELSEATFNDFTNVVTEWLLKAEVVSIGT